MRAPAPTCTTRSGGQGTNEASEYSLITTGKDSETAVELFGYQSLGQQDLTLRDTRSGLGARLQQELALHEQEHQPGAGEAAVTSPQCPDAADAVISSDICQVKAKGALERRGASVFTRDLRGAWAARQPSTPREARPSSAGTTASARRRRDRGAPRPQEVTASRKGTARGLEPSQERSFTDREGWLMAINGRAYACRRRPAPACRAVDQAGEVSRTLTGVEGSAPVQEVRQ